MHTFTTKLHETKAKKQYRPYMGNNVIIAIARRHHIANWQSMSRTKKARILTIGYLNINVKLFHYSRL
jgi:hypothetical protein